MCIFNGNAKFSQFTIIVLVFFFKILFFFIVQDENKWAELRFSEHKGFFIFPDLLFQIFQKFNDILVLQKLLWFHNLKEFNFNILNICYKLVNKKIKVKVLIKLWPWFPVFW